MNAATDAYDNFYAAMSGHIDRFRRMSEPDFIARCLVLIEEQDAAPDPEAKLSDLVLAIAKNGSIEACAALAVMGARQSDLRAALETFCDRFADLKEGRRDHGARRHVAAGRASVRIGPDGRKLYSTRKDGAP